jgi:outer membrane receptor for ferrienterochelin and colicins
MIIKSEPSLFYNHINNLITLAQSSGTEYTYLNIGTYKTEGIQLNNELAYKHIKISAGISYTGRYNDLPGSADRFGYATELRSNIYYEIKKAGITAAVFYKYSGKLPGYSLAADNTVVENYTEDYHTADLSVSKFLFKKRIVFGIGCKNMFDVKNINSFAAGGAHSSGSGSIPVATGRSYFTKLELNLFK